MLKSRSAVLTFISLIIGFYCQSIYVSMHTNSWKIVAFHVDKPKLFFFGLIVSATVMATLLLATKRIRPRLTEPLFVVGTWCVATVIHMFAFAACFLVEGDAGSIRYLLDSSMMWQATIIGLVITLIAMVTNWIDGSRPPLPNVSVRYPTTSPPRRTIDEGPTDPIDINTHRQPETRRRHG